MGEIPPKTTKGIKMPRWRDVNEILEEESQREVDMEAENQMNRLGSLMSQAPGPVYKKKKVKRGE